MVAACEQFKGNWLIACRLRFCKYCTKVETWEQNSFKEVVYFCTKIRKQWLQNRSIRSPCISLSTLSPSVISFFPCSRMYCLKSYLICHRCQRHLNVSLTWLLGWYSTEDRSEWVALIPSLSDEDEDSDTITVCSDEELGALLSYVRFFSLSLP